MPQNEYMEKHRKEHGRRLDHEERVRKREAREAHTISAKATNLRGFKAKMFAEERRKHKIQLRKQIKALEEKNVQSAGEKDPSQPLPSYLLDRNNPQQAKTLSSAIKNRRSEKSARYSVPIPKVSALSPELPKHFKTPLRIDFIDTEGFLDLGISEEDMFKVVTTGKRKSKGWKRMVTMPTFVGPDFTRRPVKFERFIRPSGLRYTKAHTTHPELNVTVQLQIISVKKNPQNQLYTQLGCLTKGTIIEVNVSELGLTTAGGKVVWGRYAQITNKPEEDGCVNAVLLT